GGLANMRNSKFQAMRASLMLLSAGAVLGSGAAFGEGPAANSVQVDKTVQISKKDLQPVELNGGFGGGANVPAVQMPYGVNVFNLSLAETQLYSQSYNYEVVGHSYFHGFEQYQSAASVA